MGPIADRSIEHLGSSDSALIRVRRLWLSAVQDGLPLGVTAPESYRVRATGFVIGRDEDWTTAAADWVNGRPDAVPPALS
jgi:phthalate 4,5-dioxygenase oxygenase subunit